MVVIRPFLCPMCNFNRNINSFCLASIGRWLYAMPEHGGQRKTSASWFSPAVRHQGSGQETQVIRLDNKGRYPLTHSAQGGAGFLFVWLVGWLVLFFGWSSGCTCCSKCTVPSGLLCLAARGWTLTSLYIHSFFTSVSPVMVTVSFAWRVRIDANYTKISWARFLMRHSRKRGKEEQRRKERPYQQSLLQKIRKVMCDQAFRRKWPEWEPTWGRQWPVLLQEANSKAFAFFQRSKDGEWTRLRERRKKWESNACEVTASPSVGSSTYHLSHVAGKWDPARSWPLKSLSLCTCTPQCCRSPAP